MNSYQLYLMQQQAEEEAKRQNQSRNYFRGWVNNKSNEIISKAVDDYITNNVTPVVAEKIGNSAFGKAVSDIGGKVIGSLASGTATGITGTAAGTAAGAGAGGAAAGAGSAAGGAGGAATGTAAGGAAGGSLGAAAGPIGALIGLILTGTNRKRAKSASGQLLKQTNELAEQGVNETESALNENNPLINENIQQAVQPLKLMQPSETKEYNPMTDMPTYLNGQGYPGDINYSAYNDVPSVPIQEGQIAKQSLKNKLVNGISDFTKGYEENRNNAFSPENLLNDRFREVKQGPSVDGESNISEINYTDKSKMGRLGEFAGSVARIANKPAVQAAVAGTVSTLLTGNPLYGAGMAYKFGSGKDKTNIYEQALKDYGVNINNGALTNLDRSDFSTLMAPKYKEKDAAIREDYYEDLKDWHIAQAEAKKEANQVRKEANQIRRDELEAKINGKPNKGNGVPSDTYVIMEAPNGKRYKVPENQIKRYKAAGGKVVG